MTAVREEIQAASSVRKGLELRFTTGHCEYAYTQFVVHQHDGKPHQFLTRLTSDFFLNYLH